jgi:hypothetical protein
MSVVEISRINIVFATETGQTTYIESALTKQ